MVRKFDCWIETPPVYEFNITDEPKGMITKNGERLPFADAADLLNKLDPKGEAK